MADYIAQPDAAVEPDAPITSDLMYALRDNPIAIAEGADGAPRIRDVALGSLVTVAGRSWVADRISSANWDFIGQVVMATYKGSVGVATGGEVSGSLLSPANASGESPGSTLPGKWRLQGYIGSISGTPPQSRTSIWQRVS